MIMYEQANANVPKTVIGAIYQLSQTSIQIAYSDQLIAEGVDVVIDESPVLPDETITSGSFTMVISSYINGHRLLEDIVISFTLTANQFNDLVRGSSATGTYVLDISSFVFGENNPNVFKIVYTSPDEPVRYVRVAFEDGMTKLPILLQNDLATVAGSNTDYVARSMAEGAQETADDSISTASKALSKSADAESKVDEALDKIAKNNRIYISR